jgi:hypothetical protein
MAFGSSSEQQHLHQQGALPLESSHHLSKALQKQCFLHAALPVCCLIPAIKHPNDHVAWVFQPTTVAQARILSLFRGPLPQPTAVYQKP